MDNLDPQSESEVSPQTDNSSESAMLSALEARVLGALMEKQLTTPDAYPLSLNSLVLACNQKTSREPVMNLANGEVQRCLNKLEERNLADIEYASRADKYKQKITRFLHFNKSEQAVFSLMLLRGAQTVNELLSRSKRMHDFASAADVEEILTAQSEKLKPLVLKIPAQAGQREDRYTHLLCGEPDLSAIAMSQSERKSTSSSSTQELIARVEVLEKQVAELMEKMNN